MKHVLVTVLKGYRLVVSPVYGQSCRYYPSCSAYALAAVERHGAVKGTWLAVRRLGRCHPWCAGGVDFVPTAQTYRWWGRAEGTDGEVAPRTSEPGGAPASSAISSPDALNVLRGV